MGSDSILVEGLKIADSTINAKAETIATSPAYRDAIKRRRCLVPADWFYEWKKIDAKTKQPYAIALNDGSLVRICRPLGDMERQGHRANDRDVHHYHYRPEPTGGTTA